MSESGSREVRFYGGVRPSSLSQKNAGPSRVSCRGTIRPVNRLIDKAAHRFHKIRRLNAVPQEGEFGQHVLQTTEQEPASCRTRQRSRSGPIDSIQVVNALPGVDVHPLGRQASLGKVSDYDRGVAQPNHNREWSGQQASLEAFVRTAVESWPVA